MNALSEHSKHLVDALSVGALLATLLDLLPVVTALLVAVWTVMRMIESWQQIKLNNRDLNDKE